MRKCNRKIYGGAIGEVRNPTGGLSVNKCGLAKLENKKGYRGVQNNGGGGQSIKMLTGCAAHSVGLPESLFCVWGGWGTTVLLPD